MTPLRWLGLIVLVFAVSLPVTHFIRYAGIRAMAGAAAWGGWRAVERFDFQLEGAENRVEVHPAQRKTHGIPKLPAHESPTDQDEGEDKDDPVVDAYCLKGLKALSDGQHDKAIAAYTSAIERDPKYSYAYLGRGDAYVAKGDLDRALLDYDRAVHLDPNNNAAKARADAVRAERDRK